MSYWLLQRKKRKRRYWVHPHNFHNIIMHHSSAMVSKKLAPHEIKFMEFYKINIENFKFLLEFTYYRTKRHTLIINWLLLQHDAHVRIKSISAYVIILASLLRHINRIRQVFILYKYCKTDVTIAPVCGHLSINNEFYTLSRDISCKIFAACRSGVRPALSVLEYTWCEAANR